MSLEFWSWGVKEGGSWMIIAFIGVIIWRLLFGTKTKDGYLDRMAKRFLAHASEQSKAIADNIEQGERTDEALRVLVQSGEPPRGAAYVAAQAVYRTATNVEQMQGAIEQAVKVCRLVASQFPSVEKDIGAHCDEIERIMKQSM